MNWRRLSGFVAYGSQGRLQLSRLQLNVVHKVSYIIVFSFVLKYPSFKHNDSVKYNVTKLLDHLCEKDYIAAVCIK